MSSNDRVKEIVSQILDSRDIYLEEVAIKPAGRRSIVQILIDSAGGLDLDLVAAVSREISDALDQTDALGNNPYTLDVGSPGIDRPLTLPRHWQRNKNRLVQIETSQDEVVVDRIMESDEVAVTLKETGRVISFKDIKRAQVQIEFNRAD
jgi:ribosome maturation factor RimP